ncbi:FAD-dependent oxidoreductase [bacterium]|nr:FAD-dependent oxidoreductase [bacterium]
MFDLIIIGGGPAGITAAIYAIRKKINTLLISRDFVGQAGEASIIENWPGYKKITGLELLKRMKEHLDSLGAQIKQEEVVELDKKDNFFVVKTSQNNEYQAKSVIVASGASPRSLEVPGEREFIGKGVSYCVTCDAPFFKEKVVAVVGGGNSGLEAALELVKYAKKVYILEFSSQLKGDEVLQEKVEKEKKIEVILSAKTEEIKGDNFVREISYSDRVSGKKKSLSVDGVFVQIGRVPATVFVKEDLVEFSERGEIKIEPGTNKTKTPGLFAAGDVSSVAFKQIIIAAGEGAKAALFCYDYLKNLK